MSSLKKIKSNTDQMSHRPDSTLRFIMRVIKENDGERGRAALLLKDN